MTTSETTVTDSATLPSAKAVARPLQKSALAAIFFSHLAVDMQTSSLAVLLPPLLATFSLTYASAAGIISANNIIIAIAQPMFGIFGDYRRARWLVPVGCAVCGLAMATVMFAPMYALIIFAVIVSGLGSAAFHPEALSSTRAVSGDQTTTGSSIFFFAGNLGFALGPLVATLLLQRWGAPGALGMLIPVGLGLSVLALQWKKFLLPEAIVYSTTPRALIAARPSRQTLLTVSFLLVFIVMRLITSGGLQTFIPLYFTRHSILAPDAIAQLLTVYSLSGTVGTLFSGPMAERIGRRSVVAISMVIALAALAIFLRSSGLVQLVAVAVGGAALSAPWTLTVVMMQEALPRNVGLASGLSLGTAYGAMGIAVALLGKFADVFGLPVIMQVITLMPVIVLVMGFFVPEKKSS